MDLIAQFKSRKELATDPPVENRTLDQRNYSLNLALALTTTWGQLCMCAHYMTLPLFKVFTKPKPIPLIYKNLESSVSPIRKFSPYDFEAFLSQKPITQP